MTIGATQGLGPAASGFDRADGSRASRAPAPPPAEAAAGDTVAAETAYTLDPDAAFAALSARGVAVADGDAARLLALSLRQGIQANGLGIANVSPNSVLGLLRA